MASDETAPFGTPCPRCHQMMLATTVRTAIWQRERLAVVEDIPAHVCSACMEQFYDDDVSDALRQLSEDGFPQSAAIKTIEVPVFSLERRIRKRKAASEDSYVD